MQELQWEKLWDGFFSAASSFGTYYVELEGGEWSVTRISVVMPDSVLAEIELGKSYSVKKASEIAQADFEAMQSQKKCQWKISKDGWKLPCYSVPQRIVVKQKDKKITMVEGYKFCPNCGKLVEHKN